MKTRSLFAFFVSLSLLLSSQNHLRVLNNSADKISDTLKVWVGSQPPQLLPYRHLTPGIIYPTGTQTVYVGYRTVTGINQAFAQANIPVSGTTDYLLVIGGIVSVTGYTPGGNTRGIAIHVFTVNPASTVPSNQVVVHLMNECTDANGISAFLGTTQMNFGQWGMASVIPSVSAVPASLKVKNSITTLGNWDFPFDQFGGGDMWVTTCGFIDPSKNSNGPPFSLNIIPALDSNIDTLTTLQLSVSTGVDRFAGPFTARVFPNPCSDRLHVTTVGSVDGAVNVSVTNALGKLVCDAEILKDENGHLELSLTDLPQGLYFVTINTSAGTSVVKVVKTL